MVQALDRRRRDIPTAIEHNDTSKEGQKLKNFDFLRLNFDERFVDATAQFRGHATSARCALVFPFYLKKLQFVNKQQDYRGLCSEARSEPFGH